MKFVKLITILIMSIFYIGVGIAHFVNPQKFLDIIPPVFPAPLFLVYISGLFEVLFGLLLIIKRFRFYAGIGLILLLIAVFPANIFLYMNDDVRQLYGSVSKQDALIRMFFQIPLIILAYWHSQEKSKKYFSYICCALSVPTVLYFISILF